LSEIKAARFTLIEMGQKIDLYLGLAHQMISLVKLNGYLKTTKSGIAFDSIYPAATLKF
jgi:hypothetical protein